MSVRISSMLAWRPTVAIFAILTVFGVGSLTVHGQWGAGPRPIQPAPSAGGQQFNRPFIVPVIGGQGQRAPFGVVGNVGIGGQIAGFGGQQGGFGGQQAGLGGGQFGIGLGGGTFTQPTTHLGWQGMVSNVGFIGGGFNQNGQIQGFGGGMAGQQGIGGFAQQGGIGGGFNQQGGLAGIGGQAGMAGVGGQAGVAGVGGQGGMVGVGGQAGVAGGMNGVAGIAGQMNGAGGGQFGIGLGGGNFTQPTTHLGWQGIVSNVGFIGGGFNQVGGFGGFAGFAGQGGGFGGQVGGFGGQVGGIGGIGGGGKIGGFNGLYGL